MKRSALGKGIAALIPEGASLRPGTVTEVAIGEIRPNPLQPRRQFAAAGLEELAASIREHGLLQPVLVSRSPAGGYELIAGERRWRASRLAGLERIPVVLRDAVADADQLALALIENLQREDLTPIEEARAYHHLRAELLPQRALTSVRPAAVGADGIDFAVVGALAGRRPGNQPGSVVDFLVDARHQSR